MAAKVKLLACPGQPVKVQICSNGVVKLCPTGGPPDPEPCGECTRYLFCFLVSGSFSGFFYDGYYATPNYDGSDSLQFVFVAFDCDEFSRDGDGHWTATTSDGLGGTITVTETVDNAGKPGFDFEHWNLVGDTWNGFPVASPALIVSCCDDSSDFDFSTAPETIYAFAVDPSTGALTSLADQQMQLSTPDGGGPIWDGSLHLNMGDGFSPFPRYESGEVRVHQIDGTYAAVFIRTPKLSTLEFFTANPFDTPIGGIFLGEYGVGACVTTAGPFNQWIFGDAGNGWNPIDGTYGAAGGTGPWAMPLRILLADTP